MLNMNDEGRVATMAAVYDNSDEAWAFASPHDPQHSANLTMQRWQPTIILLFYWIIQ